MEVKIIEATESPLLKRKHVVASLIFPGEKTPSNKDVTAAIAKATSTPEDAVRVRNIQTVFGTTTARVDAYAYQSKALLEKTESMHKKKEAAPAQGAPPAEAKK